MNEPVKIPATPPVVTGGKPAAENNGAVPPPPVVPPLVAASGSEPKLFGGHKGGGKKRKDGLVAGSPAAIEADKAAHAKRMRDKRSEDKAAMQPPPLARPASSPASPAAAVGTGEPVLRLPVDFQSAAPAAAPGAFPTFVPWLQSKLQKPAALLTKIIARVRDFARTKQVKRLNLTPEREKKILTSLKWRDEVVNDFSTALAECATIELNKRSIGGAEHAHYLTLAMSTGELIYQEIETSRLIESLVLEDRAEKATAEKN